MFRFFASDPNKINPHYWAEKIEALADEHSSGSMTFEGDVFKQELIDSLDGYGVVGDHKNEVEDALASEIEWCDDESYVRRQVDDFEHEGFRFTDTHEISGKVYRYHYIWLIRAICWAIGQYEQQKAVSAPTGPHWVCVGQDEYQAFYKNRTLSVSRTSWIVYLASLSSVKNGVAMDMEQAKAAAKAWVDG